VSSDRTALRVQDIIDNIDRIEIYLDSVQLEKFTADRMRVDAVERCLQRITEAAIKIGEDAMLEVAPAIPLHVLRGLGNILRHQYDGIDDQLIFDTVHNDLPRLKSACKAYLAGDEVG
jgi:uncharacterized protein with HEPN domain